MSFVRTQNFVYIDSQVVVVASIYDARCTCSEDAATILDNLELTFHKHMPRDIDGGTK